MGSITLSGFNQIDFNLILNAVMEQERAPLRALQTARAALKSQRDAFAEMATKLTALEGTVEALAGSDAFGGRAVTLNETTTVSVAANTSAAEGVYEIVVNEMARAQVTATTSTHADRDTTIVTTGGTLVINGVTVVVAGETTLQGLADAINRTPDVGVRATVVNAGGNYQLVLIGLRTGAANAFTVENNLTGGTGVTFSDTNAVEASDADILVNNIHVTSASNTIEDAIPGATLTLLKKNPSTPVTATIARDDASTKARIEAFISAYNDLVKFLDAQSAAAARGDQSSIARDAVLRSLRSSLRQLLNSAYDAGGQFQYGSQVGIGFTRTGELAFDASAFDAAVQAGLDDLQRFFTGSAGQDGLFDALKSLLDDYLGGGGMVSGATTRLDSQMRQLDTRMAEMEERLAIRQRALQQEYIAADMAMSRLNAQIASLSALGNQYRLF